MTGRHINNAGVLFFCNKATKFFTNASIVCVLYKGTERVDILDKKEFNADLISNFNDTHDYIVSKLNTNYIIKGKERINKLELPEEALREAIINAMVHRNYFSQGHIQIDIFLDRVEISNPGNLLFDKRELGKVSIPRNPIIMDLMHRTNYVEKIGSGINRIKKLIREYGLEVNFEVDSDWFRIIFYRKLQRGKADEGLNEGLNVLLDIIKNNPGIKAKDVSGLLNKPIKTIERHIKELTQKKLIERRGSKKIGGYHIKE